jgi:hypothetical protein
MKSQHRHELETNVLAQRLEVAIERVRPYMATIVGVVVAIAVVAAIWSYSTGTSASRKTAAWDAYIRSVARVPPDLDQLRRSAEEYSGTAMQQLADLTWADGQVLIAANNYIYNRQAANEALARAAGGYQNILRTTNDERLVNRARLGLARVYEIQNELEKAREEYLKVSGGFAEYAKQQVERLEKPATKEDYAWLASAQAPRPRAPLGPGTPGQRPEFSPGDLDLPGSPPEGATPDTPAGDSFENLLRGLDLNFPEAGEPNSTDGGPVMPPLETAAPATEPQPPPAPDDKPAE